MPYRNLPPNPTIQNKMERCVADVKARGGDKNAYAICYTSLVGKLKGRHKAKQKK